MSIPHFLGQTHQSRRRRQTERLARRRHLSLGSEQLEPRLMLAGIAPEIVVGRVLSAYSAADVQDNQLKITYTVYNQQAEDVSGILLTTTLQEGVSLVTATQLPDQNGQELAWSLGTLPAYGRASVEVTVGLPSSSVLTLDGGAAAFGTVNARATSDTTPAAVLNADPLPAALLASTADANTTDPFIQEKAAALDYSPQNIIAFLQDEVGYESYSGSLRGARGTLWSSAGNALDEASLGVALFRASGIPAQYSHGTLPDPLAQQLILSMFPEAYQVVGYVPPGSDVADPANDSQLLAESRQHYWIQFDAGAGLRDIDTTFPNAQAGHTFHAGAATTFAEVDDALRHKVRIKLDAETFSQLGAAFGLDGGFGTKTVLDETFHSVDLVGRPLSIGHFVSETSIPSPIFVSRTITYSPYIRLGDTAFDLSTDDLTRGDDYQEVLTNFPLGTQALTGLFLKIAVSGPGNSTENFERALVDRVGFAARQGGSASNLSIDPNGPAAITDFDVHTLYAVSSLTHFSSPVRTGVALQRVGQNFSIPHGLDEAAQSEKLAPLLREFFVGETRAVAEAFLRVSDHLTDGLAASALVKAYTDRPRLIIASNQVIHDEVTGNSAAVVSMDLRSDTVRALAFPGQAHVAVISFNTVRGLAENVAESEVPGVVLSVIDNVGPAINTANVFVAAEREEIELAVITRDTLSLLGSLQLSPDAKARITVAVSEGKVVAVPTESVVLDGKPTVGWYELDPATGNTVGVMEDGTHGTTAEYLFWLLLGAGATVTVLGLAIGLVHGGNPITGIPQAAKDVGNGLKGFGEGIIKSAPALLPVIKNTFKTLAIRLGTTGWLGRSTEEYSKWARKIDPSAEGLLLGFPTVDSSNVASTTMSVPAGLANGDIQGTVSLPNLSISGQVQALWDSAAINVFQLNSLLSTNATVRDIDGAALGSGMVALTASTSLSGSGNVTYQVAGTGELAFYAPAITNLGVSGDWKSYSAQISGTATLAVTTDRLTLNGVLLAPGTYTISTTDATLTGSGITSSPDFAGSVAIAVTGGTIKLGPTGGNMSLAGLPLDLSDGATFAGYNGNISVTANDGTDTVTLNGNAGAALRLVGLPAALETNQNATVTFDVDVLTSLADTYEVTAIAPDGWTIGFDAIDRVTVKPRPGLQGGTFPVRLVARSQSDPDLVAAVDVMVTITPTLPGLDFDVLADDQFTVPFFGAEVPTAFRTTVRNLGPAADSYALSFPNPPAGFSILPSKTIATVPAGEMGIVGIYLQPSAQMPAPGTPVSFTVTATSATDPAITQSETITFNMPTVAAVAVESDVAAVATVPGAPVSAEVTIQNVGNVPYNLALGATLPDGLAISGLTTPVSLEIGESTTQTVTFTPSANTPLNATLTPTIVYGPAVGQDIAAVVQVKTDDSHVEAGQTVQVSADVLAGMLQAQVGSAAFVVRDATGAAVFQSSAVPVELGVTAAASTIDLGALNTTGFAAGQYTIEATVRDSNQQPLMGAVGVGTLVVGLPLAATQQVTPSTLTEGLELTYVTGNATVESSITIAAEPLVSLIDTSGAALNVAVNGSRAYVAGTQDVTIVDLSDPARPEIVGTFGKNDLAQDALNVLQLSGSNLIVASQNTLNANLSNLLVYSLANPLSPQLISNTTIPYRFITDLLVQGNTALLPTGGITFSLPGSITGQFGDVVAVNFSSPGNPVVADALFNTSGSPNGGNTRQSGGTVVNNRLAYIGSTTAAGSNTQGVGRLLVVDTSSPANLAVVRELLIPGTAHVLDVAIEGDRALVVGSSGGTRNPFNGFGDLGLTGTLTLTVLDISDRQNPQLLGTTAVTDAEFPKGSTPGLLQAVALGSGRFAVSGVQLPDAGPVIVVADASDPAAIAARNLAVPSLVNGLSVSGDFLHATSAAGLATYRIDAVAELSVHVEIQVPTEAGVEIAADSFNLAPTQIIAGAGFDTLIWDLTLGAEQPSQELTWQSDITGMLPGTVRNVTLGTSIGFLTAGGADQLSLPAQMVASVPATQTLQIPVRVVVPGADAIASASITAGQIGKVDLGNRLSDLATALTGLVQTPTSEVFKSQAVASLDAVIRLTENDSLSGSVVPALRSDKTALATASTPSAIQAAIQSLGRTLGTLDAILTNQKAHDFVLVLAPDTALAQLGVPAIFGVMLENVGSLTTTYNLSVSGLPPEVTAVFTQSGQPIQSVTLQPGQADNGAVFGGIEPVSLELTETGNSLFRATFTVTVTVDGQPEFGRSLTGTLRVQSDLVEVVDVAANPAFTNPGGAVDVTARVLNAVNAPQQALASYTVTSPSGSIVFVSTPAPLTLSVPTTLVTVDMGRFETTGLANGDYTILVTLTDLSGRPIPGAMGEGRVQIGLPVGASLTVSPDSLPSTNGTVANTLQINRNTTLPDTLTLFGQVPTTPSATTVTLYRAAGHNLAYVGGTNGIDIVDVSVPNSPINVGTFGETLIVRGGFTSVRVGTIAGTDYLVVGSQVTSNASRFTILMYSLADPLNPSLVNGPTGTPISHVFASDLEIQGNAILISTTGASGFFPRPITTQFGNVLSIDVSDPSAPLLKDVVFDSPGPPQSGTTNQHDVEFVDNQFAYIASTTSTGSNLQEGVGRILVVDYSDTTNLQLLRQVVIPGTVHALNVAVQGNFALVVGSTGGLVDFVSALAGNLTLSVLDISDHANPVLVGTTRVTGGTFPDPSFGVAKLSSLPLSNGLFAVSETLIDGNPVLLLVDPSDPNNILVTNTPTPKLLDEMAVAENLLYTASADGLTIYQVLGSVPVTATVRIPNGTGVAIVPDSFNIAPTQIIAGASFDTLLWQLTADAGELADTFTWQTTVENLQPDENRKVTLGATIDFVSQGTAGTLELASTSVVSLADEPVVLVDPQSHGIVATLTPTTATAGPGTTAAYKARLTNTGSETDAFSLTAVLPPGVTGVFSQNTVTIPPGASNFRDVQLLLTASSAATLGALEFRINAVAADDATITDSATGTLHVVSQGVNVALSPSAGPPGSFEMLVTNTGSVDDIFDLSVGGPVGLLAIIQAPSVSLAAGASQTVRIDVGTIDFATPGAIALFGIATSRANSAVRDAARADIVIPEQQAVAARFQQDSVQLPGPGPASMLLFVDNLGNLEDAYTATIEDTNGSLTATLIGIDGLPTQTIPVFRLPGLATGAILVNVNMAETGVGGLRVRIRSLSEPEVTSLATLAVIVPSAVAGMRLDCSPLHVGLNTCTVLGATKGGVANLAVGVQPGERRLSKFGVTVGMADPTVVAQGIVQPDGRAVVQVLISSEELLHRILLQAFEQVPTPRTTNIEVVGTPILSTGPRGTHTAALDPEKLPALRSEAIARWEATGLTLSESVLLRFARIETADLASGLLGQTIGSTIYVDTTADGHGWFVDPSPSDDAEFAAVTAPGERTAVGNAPPIGRIDLLTVLMHEYGHILGSDDVDAQEGRSLMTQELPTATRRLPGEDAVVAANALDVNRDGLVSPIDALLVINYLNRAASNPFTLRSSSLALDVNRDGLTSPLDALLVINNLNRNSRSSLPGEGESPLRTWVPPAVRTVDASPWKRYPSAGPVHDREICDDLLDEITAPSSRSSVHASITDEFFEELSGMLEE